MSGVLQVGAIGLGGWAHALAKAYTRSDRLRLIGCFSRSAQRRERFAAAFGCTPAATLEELLARPELDAVIVTVANAAHAEVVEAAARAGKHVFLEKPIAADMEDARRIRAALDASKTVFACGHSARYLCGVRRLKSLLEDGVLGEVSHLEATFANPRGLTLSPGDWRADPAEAPGGVLTQIGVHQIDNVRYLFGDIEWVYCAGTRAPDTGVECLAQLVLGCPGGRLAAVSVNWRAQGAFSLRVYGSLANVRYALDQRWWSDSARADAHSSLELDAAAGAGIASGPVALATGDYLREQVEAWADAIRERHPVEVDARVAERNLAVVLAAVRSMREARPVEVREID